MNPSTGKYIIFVGAAIVVIGILVYFFSDKLNWFTRLPGDIRVERENFHFYFPITSMILLSIFISVILYLIRRFL
jgi:H+/Cl- antiporter ClcA